jgi:hypothetical protein
MRPSRSIRIRLACDQFETQLSSPLDEQSRVRPTVADHGLPRTSVSLANGDDAGVWQLTVVAQDAWPADVITELEIDVPGGPGRSSIVWPMYYGTFERQALTDQRVGNFRGPGRTLQELPDDRRLSLPMAVVETEASCWLVGTDPRFSTTIAVFPNESGDRRLVLGWRWLAAAGIHSEETRTIFVVRAQDIRSALERWFELATPEIPAGPTWLHEIALQNFDYLSKSGRGWFEDIDAVCDLVGTADRHRAIFTLHGWYDEVGRYCYDSTAHRLEEQWTAFPLADSLPNFVHTISHPVSPGIPNGPGNHGWRNLAHCRPVALSWDDVRERLRYAKALGLRTGFYAMTGMLAAGEPRHHIELGTGLDVEPHWPGGWWQGPDLQGPAYVRNPLHTEVREGLLGYIGALLEKIGDLTDALVMDESYYVPRGALGPSACPGYADRGQAQLIQEIAALCHDYRPDLAFLTSDELGANFLRHDVFPYSLFADGIYHDAWCLPESWDCVRLPTWRNVAWSVNWAPVTNLAWTRWAVVTHNAPIAISNGNFGDDTGIAEFDDATAAMIAELWNLRKHRQREKPLLLADAPM